MPGITTSNIFIIYLDEVETLDDVETDDDVDTELEVEILKCNETGFMES